jgi:hypothetical protein
MTGSEEVEAGLQVQAIWPEGLSEAAQVANQFALTDDPAGPGAVYLMFGHLAAPVWLSQEHAEQRLKQLGGSVTISPRGAFYMTRANAERLRDLLDSHLKRGQK